MNLRGSSVFFRCIVAFAIIVCSNGVAISATDKGAELKAVQALIKRCEAQLGDWDLHGGRDISVTKSKKDGYWESIDYQIAWFDSMRQILRVEKKLHPELIAYWIKRTEDSSKHGQIEKGGFADQSIALIAQIPALSPWVDKLRNATISLSDVNEKQASTEWWAYDHPHEIKASYKSNGVWKIREEFRKVIEGMLSSAGILDPLSNGAWKPVYEFLINDMDQQLAQAEGSYDKNIDVLPSMRRAFWEAIHSPSFDFAVFAKLEKMDQSIISLRIKLYEQALAPGKTPMEFLASNTQKFIDLQIKFDRELVRFLDSSVAREKDPNGISGIRGAYGLYPIRDSLERREDLLKAGSWTQSLHLLANEIGKKYYLASRWERHDLSAAPWMRYDFPLDPDTGNYLLEPINQQIGQNVDLINKYRERWIKNGNPPGPLYAAVDVDNQGQPVWVLGGWLMWQWITPEDLDDLTVDGRVIGSLGRRWLLPTDAASTSIKSLQDVHSSNAREIIVAIDPAGEWKRIGGTNR